MLASLQVPFLLNIAASALNHVQVFPFAPQATFELFEKLDLAFSSLVTGTDPDSGGPLPGYETGRKMSVTEKVRLRGIIGRTRVQVMKVAASGRVPGGETNGLLSDTDVDSTPHRNYEEKNDCKMELARIYEKTLIELESALDNTEGFTASLA